MLLVLLLCVLLSRGIDAAETTKGRCALQLGIWYTRKPLEYAYIIFQKAEA